MHIIKKFIVLISFLLHYLSFSQGGATSCAQLEANPAPYQSCATSIPFDNQTTNNSESIQPSCFGQTIKAPTWFFMKIKTSGDIVLQISQETPTGQGIDVDFALWGPFGNLNNVCNLLINSNEVDCSWLPDSVEEVLLQNAQQGELYILMVDNFEQISGQIAITQIGGSGSSDCGFLSSVSIKDASNNEITQFDYCKPATQVLKALVDITDFNANPADLRFNYRWSKDGVVISTLNNSLANNNSITVNETGLYKVEVAAYDVTDPTIDINNIPFLPDQTDEITLNFIDTPQLNTNPIIINQCDFIAPNNDGFAIINLNTFYDTITNSVPNINLKFYLDSGLTQEVINVNQFQNTIAFNQTLYVVGTFNNSSLVCNSNVISINLIIDPTSLEVYPNPPSACPILNQNYGFIDFDAQRNLIKNTYFPTSTVTINFYLSASDALLDVNSLSNSTQIPVGSTTIYVKISSNNNCVAIGNFVVEIAVAPTFIGTISPINACLSDEIILATKDNELLQNQTSNIETSYFYSNNDALSNSNSIDKNLPLNITTTGSIEIYVRLFNTINQCFSIYNFTINILIEPLSITINPNEIIIFEGDTSVTAIVQPPSNEYIYSLDNGPWQESNVFNNFYIGNHTITVKNRNGCNELDASFTVIDFIRYFTPNNDGYNDYWKIENTELFQTLGLYIYDRYGKLIKSIDQNTNGWDGTFQNIQLPSDDYWFKIIYLRNGIEKEFTSHFSLKR